MSSKYKMFLNFMFNDLGITKDDIKEWTEQAVQMKVDKVIKQINIEDIIKKRVDKFVSHHNSGSFMDCVEKNISKEIAGRILISINEVKDE